MGLIEEFIRGIKQSRSYKKQIVHLEELPAHTAILGELEKPLPENLQKVLLNRKIQLYSHQAQAINAARSGKNVVIATPTASGKTLAFNIPVFEALTMDRKATALYIYPAKALTNDQLKVLKELEKESQIKADPNIYDGDTPQYQRANIRENSRIILTNPYGLHQYLPWHYKWRNFFQNLKFIVMDEAHIYRGVFGSNVAMVIRRLLRICNQYHATPQIILSSATIANPEEHAQRLTGKDFEVVSNDGSPRGKKSFVFWNPPFEDSTNTLRRSTHQETKDLLTLSVLQNLQTLCFTTSRQLAELITRWTKTELTAKSKSANVVTAYRAGYLPQERRDIENRLKNKNLIGVVSTNALELGIDIGSLDSVIISGYPGTVISTWQQAGRAGRSNMDSLVMLVAYQNPLDQYFMKHPSDFFGRPHEQAIIGLHNHYITTGHIMCAASELPINECDKQFFSELFSGSIQALEQGKLVKKTPHGWVYSGTARTTEMVSLGNISDKTVTVFYNGNLLETLTLNKAYEEAHTGAVLLHQGETYICESLDLNHLVAKVKQENVNYHTEALKDVEVTINKTQEKSNKGTKIGLGEVSITETYHTYVTKIYDTVNKRSPLDLPPLTFSTIGVWFSIPDKVRELVESQNLDFAGGLHAVEHAMISIAPIFAMCDRWDIGGVSTPLHPDTKEPTIFIYDGFEGGIGISEALYAKIKPLWEKTLDLIDNCECREGCPSCIYSPKCGNENEPLDKKAASIILKEMLKVCAIDKNSKEQKFDAAKRYQKTLK
ncbi:MAG: DEAD/DEAH box helicase [Nitrososphaerota archaeon]|jgi:DEAD/DEAH box helicase domain-containing protein|nr:DEAD/DEAH box helicase [Nitrososphaerota archaeon]